MTRILIVDDSADMRALLKAELQHEGYTVQAAESGRAAITMQSVFRADIVITDLFMPDGDGFEVIAKVRENSPATRIIAISAAKTTMGTDYLALAQKAGATATLRKPFKMPALLTLLQSLGVAPPKGH